MCFMIGKGEKIIMSTGSGTEFVECTRFINNIYFGELSMIYK